MSKYEARHFRATRPFIIRFYIKICCLYGDPAYGLGKHIPVDRVFNAATDKRLTGEFAEFITDMGHSRVTVGRR